MLTFLFFYFQLLEPIDSDISDEEISDILESYYDCDENNEEGENVQINEENPLYSSDSDSELPDIWEQLW